MDENLYCSNARVCIGVWAIYCQVNIFSYKLSVSIIFSLMRKKFELRDKQNYHCGLLDGYLSESDLVTNGINHRSDLNTLDFMWPAAN